MHDILDSNPGRRTAEVKGRLYRVTYCKHVRMRSVVLLERQFEAFTRSAIEVGLCNINAYCYYRPTSAVVLIYIII